MRLPTNTNEVVCRKQRSDLVSKRREFESAASSANHLTRFRLSISNVPPNIDVMHSWPGLPPVGTSALIPQSAASKSLPGLPTAESPVPVMTSMSDGGMANQLSGNPFAAGSTGNPFADAMSAQATPNP